MSEPGGRSNAGTGGRLPASGGQGSGGAAPVTGGESSGGRTCYCPPAGCGACDNPECHGPPIFCQRCDTDLDCTATLGSTFHCDLEGHGCVPSCRDSKQCAPPNTFCLTGTDPNDAGICVECIEHADCPGGFCNERHRCIECNDDPDCDQNTSRRKCNAQSACVECLNDSDCATNRCDEGRGVCVECRSNEDCSAGSMLGTGTGGASSASNGGAAGSAGSPGGGPTRTDPGQSSTGGGSGFDGPRVCMVNMACQCQNNAQCANSKFGSLCIVLEVNGNPGAGRCGCTSKDDCTLGNCAGGGCTCSGYLCTPR
jgi:hypothetical protein